MVSGATSYLGDALVRRLVADGVAVRAVVRPDSDRTRLRAISPQIDYSVDRGDVCALAEELARDPADVAIHLAGYYVADHTPDQVAALIESNVAFGARFAEAATRAGLRRFVNVGSYAQRFERGDAYQPLNLYAATKQAFADVLAYYADARDVAVVTLVLFHTYGPGDWRPKLMGAIRDAQASGRPLPLTAEDETTFDLVYVDDVVSALALAAERLCAGEPGVRDREFAVSSGRLTSMSELLEIFERVGGRPIRKNRGAYPSAARSVRAPWRGPVLPGWRPTVALEEGIRRFLGDPAGDGGPPP